MVVADTYATKDTIQLFALGCLKHFPAGSTKFSINNGFSFSIDGHSVSDPQDFLITYEERKDSLHRIHVTFLSDAAKNNRKLVEHVLTQKHSFEHRGISFQVSGLRWI